MKYSRVFIRIPVVRLYGQLLQLFPASFRAEFIEEIRYIFLKVMLEAEEHGVFKLLKISLYEITALVVSIFRERWHELRPRIDNLKGSKDRRWIMSRKPGFSRSFFVWFFANILGFGGLAALLFVLPSLMSIRSAVVSTLIISIPISLAQWVALRRFSQTSALWILTIPAGFLLYFLIVNAIPAGFLQLWDDESITVLTASFLLVGFLIGLPQWLILRHQFSDSSIWLLGSSAGIGLSCWLILVTDLINRSGVISLIVGILGYVIATGLILSRLIASHDKSQANAASAI